MKGQVALTNAWVAIKLACLIALIGHLGYTVFEKLNPEGTIAISEKILLDKIDFPSVFKICITPSFNETELKNVGYENTLAYFSGQSKYDNQLFGLSGHTKEGQTFSNASDVQNRIFYDYHSVINISWIGVIHNESFEGHTIPTNSFKLKQPNYPNNCLTFDIADVPEVKGKLLNKFVIFQSKLLCN